MKSLRYYDLVMAAFVAVLLISNIASSAKIVDWGVSLYGLRLSFDAGTLLFPLSYIFSDILTEVYGFSRARRVIWAGFGASVLMTASLWVVQLMPGGAIATISIPFTFLTGSALVLVCFFLSFRVLRPGIKKESAF
jgi:uncharacterized PurR-regulated membrane protein YhhQ (DUF165 family)